MEEWTEERLTSVDPVFLSATDKEEIYERLAFLDASHLAPEKFQPLFAVAREVMKYKGEQVLPLIST